MPATGVGFAPASAMFEQKETDERGAPTGRSFLMVHRAHASLVKQEIADTATTTLRHRTAAGMHR